MESARRSCFKPTHFESEILWQVAQRRIGVPHPSSALVLQPNMQQSRHEGSRRHHDGTAKDAEAEIRLDSIRTVRPCQDLRHIPLLKSEIRLTLEDCFGAKLIRLLVALRPRRSDTGPLLCIEHPELNRRCIGIQSHHPAQGIDLAHHLPLRLTPDGRITRHLTDGIEILSNDEGLASEPSRSH